MHETGAKIGWPIGLPAKAGTVGREGIQASAVRRCQMTEFWLLDSASSSRELSRSIAVAIEAWLNVTATPGNVGQRWYLSRR